MITDATAEVAPEDIKLLNAIRKTANSFTLVFSSDASDVNPDDITVMSEDETDVKKITGFDLDLVDGLEAVVTVSTPFKNGVTYNVTYGDSTASFEASVGEVDSIVIYTDQAEVNTATKIEFALFDENGVNVTSAQNIDKTCTVTFDGDYNHFENAKASNSTVTMTTAGDTCTVTVVYDKNDGETTPVEATQKITCKEASEKHGNAFFKEVDATPATPASDNFNDTDNCFRFYDPSNSADSIVKVPLDTTQNVHFYAEDTADGSAINYDSYEIESADESVASVTIGKSNGKWASFKVSGNSKGKVQLTITASKNGAATEYNIPVTVTEKAFASKVKVELTKPKMSNAWDKAYFGTATITVTDASGETADPTTYQPSEFKLINKNTPIDPDLAGEALYAEDPTTGFKLDTKTGIYTAYAAKEDGYIIEGSVTDKGSGKVISGRNTVAVKELNADAWRRTGDDVKYYGPKAYDSKDGDTLDDVTGLTEDEKAALPWISSVDYAKLAAKTVKVGDLTNKAEAQKEANLKDPYDTYEKEKSVETTKYWYMFTKDSDGKYAVLDDKAALIKAAVPDNNADLKTIVSVIANDKIADLTKYAGDPAGTNVEVKSIVKVQPTYSKKLVLGQDAYDDGTALWTMKAGKGATARYAVEMDTKMGYKENYTAEAKLYATMDGLFAGYVHEDGKLGDGYVIPTWATQILNIDTIRPIEKQTYFGDIVIGESDSKTKTTGLTISELYDVGTGREKAEPIADTANGLLGQAFVSVNPDTAYGNKVFYTDKKDQVITGNDEDFAREGSYKIVFSFFCGNDDKATEKTGTFTVEKDLYVPGVAVKSQTIDSYTQAGWKEAVVSEVDLNNEDPTTYSVVDLLDKNGATISDAKTPAHWVVVYEEGVNFYERLDRTFELS